MIGTADPDSDEHPNRPQNRKHCTENENAAGHSYYVSLAVVFLGRAHSSEHPHQNLQAVPGAIVTATASFELRSIAGRIVTAGSGTRSVPGRCAVTPHDEGAVAKVTAPLVVDAKRVLRTQ